MLTPSRDRSSLAHKKPFISDWRWWWRSDWRRSLNESVFHPDVSVFRLQKWPLHMFGSIQHNSLPYLLRNIAGNVLSCSPVQTNQHDLSRPPPLFAHGGLKRVLGSTFEGHAFTTFNSVTAWFFELDVLSWSDDTSDSSKGVVPEKLLHADVQECWVRLMLTEHQFKFNMLRRSYYSSPSGSLINTSSGCWDCAHRNFPTLSFRLLLLHLPPISHRADVAQRVRALKTQNIPHPSHFPAVPQYHKGWSKKMLQ